MCYGKWPARARVNCWNAFCSPSMCLWRSFTITILLLKWNYRWYKQERWETKKLYEIPSEFMALKPPLLHDVFSRISRRLSSSRAVSSATVSEKTANYHGSRVCPLPAVLLKLVLIRHRLKMFFFCDEKAILIFILYGPYWRQKRRCVGWSPSTCCGIFKVWTLTFCKPWAIC